MGHLPLAVVNALRVYASRAIALIAAARARCAGTLRTGRRLEPSSQAVRYWHSPGKGSFWTRLALPPSPEEAQRSLKTCGLSHLVCLFKPLAAPPYPRTHGRRRLRSLVSGPLRTGVWPVPAPHRAGGDG